MRSPLVVAWGVGSVLCVLACGAGDAAEIARLQAELAKAELAAKTCEVEKLRLQAAAEAAPASRGTASGICEKIELQPAQAEALRIEKAEAGKYSMCEVTVAATHAIERMSFDWVFYDDEGILLGDRIAIVKGLDAGDRARLDFRVPDGTTRVTTRSRR